jgi:acyl-CoA thioester hydrolase
MPDPTKPAPIITTQQLRFCDTDALGHINNTVYAQLFEAGRAEMLVPLDLFGGPHAIVIARLEIDFLREMTWPGEVRIETAVARIGTKSVHMRQRLWMGEAETARSRSVLAVIDVATRRAVPLTEPWRSVLAQWHLPDDNAA